MEPITLLLSDDHAIVRQGLRRLLESAKDIRIVGEAENGRQAVAEVKRLRPDVCLLDLSMPLLNGVEATRHITSTAPSTKVLILSSYNDARHVREAMEAGAAGYMMKDAASEDLLSAVREVHKGNGFFSQLVHNGLLDFSRSSVTNPVRLNARQTEILQLIAEGYATKQIAAMLSIGEKTVEKRRQTLMDRLGLHKIATLTRYAVTSGIVEVNPPLAGRKTVRSSPPVK